MKFTVNRTELLAAAQNAERIAPRVSTIEILQEGKRLCLYKLLLFRLSDDHLRAGKRRV